MTWLLGLALKWTGGRKWLAYLVLAAAAAATVAMLYGVAYSRGYKAADQKALIATLKKDKADLTTELKAAGTTITERNQTIADLEKLKHENAELSKQLAVEQGRERIVYRTLRSEAAALTAARAIETDAGPQCVFDERFVRVWNDALEGTLTVDMSNTTSGVADAVASAGVAADGVSVGDLLTNHIDNRELDTAIRSQCTALIEWHRQHDH